MYLVRCWLVGWLVACLLAWSIDAVKTLIKNVVKQQIIQTNTWLEH